MLAAAAGEEEPRDTMPAKTLSEPAGAVAVRAGRKARAAAVVLRLTEASRSLTRLSPTPLATLRSRSTQPQSLCQTSPKKSEVRRLRILKEDGVIVLKASSR